MKTALVIMAAGLGSRFKVGIKQLEPVGLNDEIIMDYSIHDALLAGFNKIVIIIRKDILNDFKERIGNRIEKVLKDNNVELVYCFQELEDLPEGFTLPKDRVKPWGTGHAVLAAKNYINEPFVVINADDYYGKDAFVKLHNFLIHNKDDNAYALAGFILKNTLSDNGSVTRGICEIDNNDYLTSIVETKNIVKTNDGAISNNNILDINSYVSMNMWAMPLSFMEVLESEFISFLNTNEDILKGEYLLPILIGDLLKKDNITVKLLETEDKWFGVTYKEDKDFVKESFKELINKGEYKERLYDDLRNDE